MIDGIDQQAARHLPERLLFGEARSQQWSLAARQLWKPPSCQGRIMKTTRSLTIVAKTDCRLDTPTAVGGAMSKYRVSFLVWWTTIVLFIAIFIWLNRDLLPTPAYDLTFFAGWAVMIFALGSWIPGAFLRLLRPEQSR